MHKVDIIIPNWNGAHKLKNHLPKVLQAAGYSNINEIIVTDDDSTDQSVEVVKNNFPEVRIVTRPENGGFSSNVNFGVLHSHADLIVLLNTDVSPKKDFLESALIHFKNQKVFSVGSNTGGSWARADFQDGFFWHSQANEKPASTHNTLWVSGGSGIFRRTIWDELGGLDTLFNPFYEEDLDIGYRATKRGYINIWEPKSLVEHYKEEGVIAKNFDKSQIQSVAQRNQLIFIWKNITSSKLFNEHKKSLIKKLVLHPKYWRVFLSALAHLPEIKQKRLKEIKESKLTDEEVLAMFSV